MSQVPQGSRSSVTGLVSIGLPVRNGATHIERSVRSLLAQDYRFLEIVVSDNASDDGTLDILRWFAGDSRVRLIENSERTDAHHNFRKVLNEASGEYFMWAASDDYWHESFVSRLKEQLDADSTKDVAMSAVECVWGDGTPIEVVSFSGSDDPSHMSHYQLLKAATSYKKYNYFIYGLYRTAFLRAAVKLLPGVPGEDRVLVAQVALATHFGYVDEPLQVRTIHRVPYAQRRPEEAISRMGRWGGLVYFATLAWMWRGITRSTLIPTRRKLLAPVAVFRYGMMLLVSRLSTRAAGLKAILPEGVVTTMKRIRDAIRPD